MHGNGLRISSVSLVIEISLFVLQNLQVFDFFSAFAFFFDHRLVGKTVDKIQRAFLKCMHITKLVENTTQDDKKVNWCSQEIFTKSID